MIETHNLTKYFKRSIPNNKFSNKILTHFFGFDHETIVAIDHITMKVNNGEIFGIVGPNGAGKTTLIKILSTLILPDKGSAAICNYDLCKDEKHIRAIIGVLTGEYTRSLYWRLTGKQNLEFFSKLYGFRETRRIDDLFEIMGLEEWKHEAVMKYSTGMKHKLALARALLNDPPILLLDEPTTGIDARSGFEIKKYIKGMRHKTILWTSHNLYEVDEMCDNIAIINSGRIIFQGKPEELKKKYTYFQKIRIELTEPKALLLSNMKNVTIKDDFTIEIITENLEQILKELDEILKRNGNIHIKNINTYSPSLEKAFINILSSNNTNK